MLGSLGMLAVGLALSATAAEAAEAMLNHWRQDGGRLEFVSAELAIQAQTPHGFHSLRIKGGEFLANGPGCGGMTFRRPDGAYVTGSYFDPANLAPWITCPTVIHVNVGDITVHSMGGLGVFKNLTGLKDDQKWFFPGVYGHAHCGSASGGAKAQELMRQLAEGK